MEKGRKRHEGLSEKVALLTAVCMLSLSMTVMAADVTKLVVLVRNQPDDLPDAVIEQFEKLNPDIKIERVTAPWDQIDDKLLTMLAADVPLDILISMSFTGWASYAVQGLFMELDKFVQNDRKELMAKGVPAFVLDGLKFNGKTKVIPYSLWASLITNYNATYFNEAGIPLPAPDWNDKNWTWDAMIQAGKKLTRFDADGRLIRAGIEIGADDIRAQGFSLMWGGDLFPPDTYENGIVRRTTFDTPENRRAFTAVTALTTEHKITHQVQPRIGTFNLQSGTIAMSLGPGGSISGQAYAGPYTWGMAPYPLPPVASQRVAMPAWVRSVAVSSGSQHPEAAWKFIKFMLTDAYEMGEFQFGSQTMSWNLNRGVSVASWQRYAQAAASSFSLAHSAAQYTRFLAEAIGLYTRFAATTLSGGGETIHVPNGPLYLALLEAYQGKISVEAALQKAERESAIILESIAKRLNLN
jgi:ABC-type glycerol-3-phosphate transport system substrate-binding protein